MYIDVYCFNVKNICSSFLFLSFAPFTLFLSKLTILFPSYELESVLYLKMSYFYKYISTYWASPLLSADKLMVLLRDGVSHCEIIRG